MYNATPASSYSYSIPISDIFSWGEMIKESSPILFTNYGSTEALVRKKDFERLVKHIAKNFAFPPMTDSNNAVLRKWLDDNLSRYKEGEEEFYYYHVLRGMFHISIKEDKKAEKDFSEAHNYELFINTIYHYQDRINRVFGSYQVAPPKSPVTQNVNSKPIAQSAVQAAASSESLFTFRNVALALAMGAIGLALYNRDLTSTALNSLANNAAHIAYKAKDCLASLYFDLFAKGEEMVIAR